MLCGVCGRNAKARGGCGFSRPCALNLAAERRDISYADLATALGIAETAVKKQLHNLRQRYRWILRDEVAQTVNDPADVDDEIRHLCAVLAAEGA